MLTIDLKRFMFELKEGALKHIGASNKAATVKLYDVTAVEAREFGDERVKLVFEDDEGNEVQTALFPEETVELSQALENILSESDIFE